MLPEIAKWMRRVEHELDILKSFDIPRPIYGSFYCEDAAITVTATLAHNYYPVTSGMTTGLCHDITFASASQLVIVYKGIYKVDWSMSISCNNPNETIEGLVLAGAAGSTQQLQTVNAVRVPAANTVGSVSGQGLINCAVGDILRLGVENETAGGHVITVNHAGLVALRIG